MSRARMLSVLPRCVESDASEVSRATIALVPRHCCSPSLASNSMARDGPVPTKSKVTAKQQKHADILNFSAIFVSLSQYLQLLIVQRSDPDPEGPEMRQRIKIDQLLGFRAAGENHQLATSKERNHPRHERMNPNEYLADGR